MILYNVTVNVDETIHFEWMEWMVATHIPEVMATGMFTDWKMWRILSRQPDESGHTYSIQYFTETIEAYNTYQRDFAPTLQRKTLEKYGEKTMAFRTVLESLE